MVLMGIDRISEYSGLFKGKALGLITNFSGVSSKLVEDMDVFAEAGYKVIKLFTPEHGLYGDLDGKAIGDARHPKYDVPMISLYGDKLAPSEEDLKDIDILVYDIQDVGLRYYTYIYTMANSMKAAGKYNIPFVVLDRPNPLGDTVEGNVMKPEFDSFVGAHGLTTRYGLTAGELGQYFADLFMQKEPGLKIDLTVIPMKGYKDSMCFPETGQLWNIPSPSIHTFNTILCYNGGCFFEATGISEGRGTAEPFQMYGAPFIELDKFVKELRNRIHNDNIAIRPRAFTPFWSKHSGKVCFGAEFIPLNDKASFLFDALVLMRTIKDMYPDDFSFVKYADVSRLASLSGDTTADDYLNGKLSMTELLEKWKTEAAEFKKQTACFKLYK